MTLLDTPALHLTRDDAPTLAVRHHPSADGRPTIVYLHGLGSDMAGDKARAVVAWAQARGFGLLLLDYRGHGESGGRFEDGGLSAWQRDAEDAIAAYVRFDSPLWLVGSSIGGWVALLLAIAHPARITAMALIAAAPDITTQMQAGFNDAQRADLARDGVTEVPTQWGSAFRISQAMLDDAQARFVMHAPIPGTAPVRLLHGQRDAEVPWELSLSIAARLATPDGQVLLVKDGDHRLSRPGDLALLEATLSLLADAQGEPGAEAISPDPASLRDA